MAVVGKDTLKGYFERGDRPNEEQFVDFIDSMYNKQDDHDFTANTIVSTGGTKILECTEQGGVMGTLYVNQLFVGGEEYDPGSDVPEMYGYKYDTVKFSFAELMNDLNIASGNYSHAEGKGSSATTTYAHAEGVNGKAGGMAAHAEGSGVTASGTCSHAEGTLTTASTPCAHAEGYMTVASGNEAHAEGDQTKATAHATHAEGSGSTANTESAHAEGKGTLAAGTGAHAEGSGTTASGSCAHAGGINTFAQYATSFVHGLNLTGASQVSGSTHFGRNGNIPTRESSTGKYMLFSVSNGTTTTPKNLFEILMSGAGTSGFFSINEGQLFSGVTTAVTSTSTHEQIPTAKACWNAISDNGMSQTTADGRYLTKKSTSNSAVTASWGSSGLTIDGNASHGLLVKGSGETTRIYGGYINTTKDLTVSGNSTLKGGNTANTLTVTGSTNLKSGTTANTMYITGNFKLSSGVSANSITTAVTSSSTDQQLPTAKACYKAITGATSSCLKKNGDTATTLTATNLTMTKGLNFTLNKVFSDSNFTHNSGGYYSTSTPKAFVTFTDAYGTNEPVYIWYKSSDYPPGSIAFIQCGYHDNRDVYVAKGYSGGSTVWEKFATDNKIYMLIFSHRTFSIGSTVYASPSAYIDCSTINV